MPKVTISAEGLMKVTISGISIHVVIPLSMPGPAANVAPGAQNSTGLILHAKEWCKLNLNS
jgi:hypothetical protein